MQFTGILIALLMALSATLAANNFGGITASNSIGGTGTYTCRTQAQVCILRLSCLYGCPDLLLSKVEQSGQLCEGCRVQSDQDSRVRL
jgi:hypothetical protein